MHPRCQLLSSNMLTYELAVRSVQSTTRCYATSSPAPVVVKNPLQRRRGGDLGSHLPKYVIPTNAYIPAYPYGDHKLFKQANKGLYGEQRIQFGNNVSHKTETKTRRKWKPNILTKSLYSIALKKKIKLRITSKVLGIIDREGGIDEYLLRDSAQRVKELGPMGWALRWTLMQRPEVIARLRAQAAALGIDQAIIDKQWPTPDMMAAKKAAEGIIPEAELINGLTHGEFAETSDQQLWEADEVDVLQLTESDKQIFRRANRQYIEALQLAQAYRKSGLVDNGPDSLKLAFLRADEHKAATFEVDRGISKKVEASITPELLEQLRKTHKTPDMDTETATSILKKKHYSDLEKVRMTAVEHEETPPLAKEHKKAKFTALLAKAQDPASHKTLDDATQTAYRKALRKAEHAIKAQLNGGKEAFAQAVLEDHQNDYFGTSIHPNIPSSQAELRV
ncbi:hypothetical protein ACN47E_007713 [Coniothyrium glycines]